MAGLYIHIPFCKQACYYCDFHFSTNQKNKRTLCNSLVQELKLQQHYLKGEAIQSIYFGGGTPSLLKSEEVSMILDAVGANFEVAQSIECTLEANPDDLSPVTLSQFYSLGINRLSIGIQSFDPKILHSLNRAHTSDQAEACISNARAAGFDSISCDLIYAIPGLSDAEWERSLHKMLSYHPEHISAYSLTIEESTVFGNWQRKGKLQPMDDDHAARQLELMVEILAANGYEQYEVSNFARNGYIARHNTNYWKQQKYLGIGPSAHSFNGVSRQFNISNNNRYIKSIQSGLIPFTQEVLTREDKINEYLLTTLRTKWGSNLHWLKEELQFDLLEKNSKYIEQLMDTKLASYQDHHLILTRKGLMMADRIASDLFLINS